MPEATTPPVLARCEITGRMVPEDEIVEINGQRVCAEGKAILLDRLKSGEVMPGELERPTVLRRFGCIFLDGLMLGVIGAVLVGIGALAGALQSALMLGVLQLVTLIINISYFTLMHGTRGQTVGKMAGKLKVVRLDGRPMDMTTAFVRSLAYVGLQILLPFVIMTNVVGLVRACNLLVGVYVIANIVTALVDTSQQRSIHDRIAGTRVIMLPT